MSRIANTSNASEKVTATANKLYSSLNSLRKALSAESATGNFDQIATIDTLLPVALDMMQASITLQRDIMTPPAIDDESVEVPIDHSYDNAA